MNVEITDPAVPNGGSVQQGPAAPLSRHGLDLPGLVFGAQGPELRDDAASWQWVFFEFMQQHRRSAPDFRRSLLALADQTHRCEASFASKLAATLNLDLPVLDALVLAVMRAHLPGEWTLLRTGTLDSRLGRAVEVYGRLTDAVRRIIATDAGAELLKLFDRQYAQHAFTNTKKLDFMLWRYGATM